MFWKKKRKEQDLIDKSNLLIKIIDEDSEILPVSFGVSKERFNYLKELLDDHAAKLRKVDKVLIELSPEFKHANELAVMAYILGFENGKAKAEYDNIANLKSLFGG